MTHTYETIFICPGDLVQEKVETTVEKVKSVVTRANGKINNVEFWGRRKLSYPIKRYRDGFYVYVVFSAPAEVLAQLDHHYRVTDTVLRGITVKVDPRHLEKMRAVRSPEALSATAPAAETTTASPAVASSAPAETTAPQAAQ